MIVYTISEQRNLFSIMYKTSLELVLNDEIGGCFKSQCPMEFLEGLAVSTT